MGSGRRYRDLTVTYTATLTNKDNPRCSKSSFNLQAGVPSGRQQIGLGKPLAGGHAFPLGHAVHNQSIPIEV